jgi:hypothetical protein
MKSVTARIMLSRLDLPGVLWVKVTALSVVEAILPFDMAPPLVWRDRWMRTPLPRL